MSEPRLPFSGIAELGRLYRSGAASPVDVVEAQLARIGEHAGLNAFITVTAAAARARARDAEAEFSAGRFRSPLHGVPFAVKDQMLLAGAPLTAGSRVAAFQVAEADSSATAVARLEEAGAIPLGTLNTHELHLGGTVAFPYGRPRNPGDPQRTPGSSSSGSAAAVAAGLCTFSLGSDTGGSIRGPAAYCGVVGLKPTWSRISRYGVVPLSSTLDTVGTITRTALDAALLLEVLAGPDPLDPTCDTRPADTYAESGSGSLAGVRIGVVEEMLDPAFSDEAAVALLKERLTVFEQLGAEVGTASLPLLATSRLVTDVIVAAEAASSHYGPLRAEYRNYDVNTRATLAVGALLPADVLVQAQRMRTLIAEQVLGCLAEFDVLAGPAANAAPRWEELLHREPVPVREDHLASVPLTQIYNLVGNPALSVPAGTTGDGLPLGIQLAAAPWQEALLLRTAGAFGKALAGLGA